MFDFFKNTSCEDISSKVYKIIRDYNLSDSNTNGYSFYNCNSANGLGNYNRTGFLNLRKTFNNIQKNNENYFLFLYVLIVYAFNNQIRFNSDGKFNLPVGKRDFNIRMQNKLKYFLNAIDSMDISFTNNDFARINSVFLSSQDFVYADPPYLITCATYNEKSWNETEEKRLLSYLDELSDNRIRFALSNVLSTDGKVNNILKQWLDEKKYNCHHLDFSYKNSNYHKKNISKTDEVLITNY